jgi:hypothetical protein
MSKEPGTDQPYDSIFIAINRLTKYGYFIPCRKNMSAKNLAYLFNRYMILQYGILKRIILDRDKLFRRFWISLINQLKIYYKLSITYHPKINRVTERLN